MNTEILNLILEILQDMEKKNKVYEDLIETQRFRLNEHEYTINQLTKDLATHENSIQDIENIDIEDELRNSCTFTELEEKVLELEEPQGFISEIGNKSFMESNREELDAITAKLSSMEKIMVGSVNLVLKKHHIIIDKI